MPDGGVAKMLGRATPGERCVAAFLESFHDAENVAQAQAQARASATAGTFVFPSGRDGGPLLVWRRAKAGMIEHVHDEIKNGLGGGPLFPVFFHAVWIARQRAGRGCRGPRGRSIPCRTV